MTALVAIRGVLIVGAGLVLSIIAVQRRRIARPVCFRLAVVAFSMSVIAVLLGLVS